MEKGLGGGQHSCWLPLLPSLPPGVEPCRKAKAKGRRRRRPTGGGVSPAAGAQAGGRASGGAVPAATVLPPAPRRWTRPGQHGSGHSCPQDSFIQFSQPESPKEESPENGSPEETSAHVRQEIQRCKELCAALEQDRVNLQMAKEAVEQKTQELREGELCKNLKQEIPLRIHVSLQVAIFLSEKEWSRLKHDKQVLKQKVEGVKKRLLWEDPARVLPALPERSMVFKGLVTSKEDTNKLMLIPKIHYPLLGGSALITFEKAEVAQRILEMKEHVVELSCGEELDWCRVRVRAVPVDLLMPSALEMGLTLSSRSMLVSGLPSLGIPEDALLDKLELFFSKTKNGGGEVETIEFLDDSDRVMVTFAEDGVAEQLIERGHIQVLLGKGKYEVKISPCMSGGITNLQLHPSRCPRTVLLTGIPDVLNEESMRDALEIHFQKGSRGGGEVDALDYIPAGQVGVAVFTEDAD
ncbi:interferon-induced 35 kDa protein [Dryobates pubescens]|uniref:interferon-induced 35 kDa protein n=1 Tax=Dryobates pubescens TaxID=118200 RepID=UPI0023B9E450|nr:interferon-induced 35 kDa protein [Dryobates pubescens]